MEYPEINARELKDYSDKIPRCTGNGIRNQQRD